MRQYGRYLCANENKLRPIVDYLIIFHLFASFVANEKSNNNSKNKNCTKLNSLIFLQVFGHCLLESSVELNTGKQQVHAKEYTAYKTLMWPDYD